MALRPETIKDIMSDRYELREFSQAYKHDVGAVRAAKAWAFAQIDISGGELPSNEYDRLEDQSDANLWLDLGNVHVDCHRENLLRRAAAARRGER